MAGLNRRGPLRRIALLLSGILLAGLLSGVLAGLPLLSPAANAQDQPEELRGVWLTANDMPVLRDRGRMQAAVDQLAELGFNRLYPVVWNGGFAYYPSRVSEARQLQDFTFRGLQGQDILAELISAGRNRGVKVIPWFEFGFMAPPESPLAQRHRSWLTQTRDGGLTSTSAAGRVVWLNPFRPEVQQLITDLVLEVVNDWGADGIQFDDHMSLPREFGYDPFTRALYRKDTGKDPPANPEDPAWVKWRADRITAFLDQLARAVRAARPGALISISPNYYDFAYKLQLQDWRQWVRRGIADELLVQIYRPDLESYLPHLSRPEVQEARQRIPTAIAVMSGQRNRPTPWALLAQKVAANRARGLGVAFFYFESLWSLGPEPPAERIAGLAQMLGPRWQVPGDPGVRGRSPPSLPPPL
ncbi:family 10 glycosylhydrolase [Synechococcus sp. CCAP 1479/9]|uniref:glycoside hydrolase family 10 protein n=1 Tax=Synechococcus sp. CCAP 1479/9 TaxID=1221593 RepID=UPI001C24892A|nr:family 10 glycosylhydrolase [Synechococcus sp. CCAP 1479/9]